MSIATTFHDRAATARSIRSPRPKRTLIQWLVSWIKRGAKGGGAVIARRAERRLDQLAERHLQSMSDHVLNDIRIVR